MAAVLAALQKMTMHSRRRRCDWRELERVVESVETLYIVQLCALMCGLRL